MKYRKKSVEVTAWQNSIGNDVPDWVMDAIIITDDGALIIRTLEGDMRASLNDWIIRGVQGEVYPCKPNIFAMTYEKPNAETRARVEGECPPPAVFTDPNNSVPTLEPITEAAKEAANLSDKLLALRSALNPTKHKFVWDEMTKLAAKFRALYATPTLEGDYVLVPREPTDEMIIAGDEANPTQWNDGTNLSFCSDVSNDVYRAMIAATPQTGDK